MTTTTARTAAPLEFDTTPAERGGNRLAAVAGVAFVVLNLATFFVAGAPPATDASATKVAAYFADHAGGIQTQLLLTGFGVAALLWWFGTLWRMLSHAENERPRLAVVAAGGLTLGLSLAIVSGAITATAAFRVEDVRTTHLLWNFSFVVLGAAGFGIGIFLLATNAVFRRTELAPRWISSVGWLAALAFFAGTASIVSDSGAATTVCLIAFFVWCVWILAVSATMWRSADA